MSLITKNGYYLTDGQSLSDLSNIIWDSTSSQYISIFDGLIYNNYREASTSAGDF